MEIHEVIFSKKYKKISSLSSIYQDPIGMIHTTLRGQDLILVLYIWFSGFWADKCAHFFFDNFFAETRILQFSSATQNDSKLHRVPNENQGENNRETTNPNTGLFHVLHIFFRRFSSVQVNLCQKLLFLHQLTHNMTTDCSLNYKFNTWKLQAQTWGEHVVYRKCFWHAEQFLYTTCSPHVLQKEELLTKI